MVACGTRNGWAISSVERPPRVRSVSATCASSSSAVWQQVKRSSSRGFLGGFLGEVEVAEEADQAGEDVAPLVPEDLLEDS
jgi:hypothetical protein